MRTRPLGHTGLTVSELCFGTWEIGGLWWGPIDAHAAQALLNAAYSAGVTAYDLSDAYGNGRSECIVGRTFAGRRDDVVLITKAGYLTGVDGAQRLYDKGCPQCYDAKYLTWCCELSLRRLETDHIDVFLLHDAPIQVLRRKGVWNTLRRLKGQGKIRAFGASTSAAGGVAAIRNGAEVIEVPFNLLNRQPVAELFPLAQEKGVGILARSPFASGRLFQKGKDSPAQSYRFLARKDRPLTSAAIKYVLAHDAVSSVVSGIMRPEELKQNVAACKRPLLTQRELAQIV